MLQCMSPFLTQMRHQHGRTIPLCDVSAHSCCGAQCGIKRAVWWAVSLGERGDECDEASSFHSRLTS